MKRFGLEMGIDLSNRYIGMSKEFLNLIQANSILDKP
jgi:hypothetical protein